MVRESGGKLSDVIPDFAKDLLQNAIEIAIQCYAITSALPDFAKDLRGRATQCYAYAWLYWLRPKRYAPCITNA